MISSSSLKRAARTFLQAFVGLMVPGLLGWLNDLTAWARDEGQRPFPDATSLAYLGVSAIVAGIIAVVALLQNGIEDATGVALLRKVPPPQHRRDDAGRVQTRTIALVALAVAVVVVLILVL